MKNFAWIIFGVTMLLLLIFVGIPGGFRDGWGTVIFDAPGPGHLNWVAANFIFVATAVVAFWPTKSKPAKV